MAGDVPRVTITERRRILKYAEGADPNVDQPFEVVEATPVVYEGQAAIDILNKLAQPQEVQS